MKKILLVSFMFVTALVTQSWAQEQVISGKVTSAEDGSAIPGVNVILKGTSTGTTSDVDGNYKLSVPSGGTLIFSFIGLVSQEFAVGSQSVIDVSMVSDVRQLGEVVVTALGISRDKKSLGYATQEVKGDELSTVKSGNFVNALSGKAAGIQIKRTTNIGGSTNVVIRGNASLTGSNQALFVIDGVPVSNANSNSKRQAQARGPFYDYGNAASDINPEDIESVNVLKGAAASALYGSRAANGVIMITTKKGKKAKGLGVTINSGLTFGTVDKSTFPKYQQQYGAGYGHYYDGTNNHWYLEDITGDGNDNQVALYTEDGSYGAAFDSNLLVYQWDSFDPDSPNYRKATPWINAKNGPISFFETPLALTNSVSLDKSFDQGSFRLSYTNFDQSGLLPNSSIKKNNFSVSSVFQVSDKLTATGYANYIKTDGLGRNSTGYNDNISGNARQWWQTNVDLKQLKDIYFATKRNVTWNPASSAGGSPPIFWDNPYWTQYENYESDSRNRFIGNISLDYKIADWISVTGRVATDTYSELQEERRAKGSVPASFGVSRGSVESGYSLKNITFTESNYDLMFNFEKDLSEVVNLKGIVGTNIRRNNYNSTHSSTSGGIGVQRLYSLQNSVGPLPFPIERDEKIGVNGIYASASLGYNDIFFMDATIRRDHSSTLPKDNSVFYYPSVSSSFVFSNLMDLDWISFGKVRANFAQVGNSAPFDFLDDTYNVFTPIGNASTSVKSTKNNANLLPETTTSVEVGLEMKFLSNRLGFDLAYYKTNSKDQILPVAVSRATGYSAKIFNTGEIENKGIELGLYGTVVKTEDLSWDVAVNWTRNRNKVLSLKEGLTNLQLGSFQGGVTINAQVGQPYGVIHGTDFTYLDPDNPKDSERLIDPVSGQYIPSSTSDNPIGDSNPDWLMGISNKLTYKNIELSFLIDIQKGGTIWSLDQYYGLATGLYAETAFINDLGNPVRNTLLDGGGFINAGVNPDGTVNSTRIRADNFGAFGYRRGLPNAAFSYDAGYVKLREIAISYQFPNKMFANTFLTGATFSVVGSNLWIISKNLPHADPESGLGSGNLQGYSTGSLPSTKDFGFNIKLQF